MRRAQLFPLAGAALALLTLAASPAQAQYRRWYYPGSYGGYGWGGWGADPASGYMAGIGSYARGLGAYEESDARARATNVDTIIRWNKALREQQRAYQQERQARDALNASQTNARLQQENLESGMVLNQLLDRILEFNPSATKVYGAKAPINPQTIRDIPFDDATEGITVCLDQMTGDDGWPPILQDDRFREDRDAIRKAVKKALDEDTKGKVSASTVKEINEAAARLRKKFLKSTGELDIIYSDADEFTKSLAGLSSMLTNPALKQVLSDLENYKGTTVGDLIVFMHTFNLRFAPATSPRQKEIYQTLVPMFEQVLVDTSGKSLEEARQAPAPRPLNDTGQPLQSAARQVFKEMPWTQVQPPPAPEPAPAPKP